MLSNTPGKKLNKYISDYVVFDLETTGTSFLEDAVIEIAAIKVKNGKVVDEFSTLVNPKQSIPYEASEVNGIYDNMVINSPTFEIVLKDFLDFVGNAVLVGHNIHKFDMKFITRDANMYWHQTIGNDYIDTLILARECLLETYHYRLVDLAEYYGISTDGAHRALNDCLMNQQVFEHLRMEMKRMKLCPKCGQILKKRNGKFGEFWGCSGYPDCHYTRNI